MNDGLKTWILFALMVLLFVILVTLSGVSWTWEYDGKWHHFQMHNGEKAPS